MLAIGDAARGRMLERRDAVGHVRIAREVPRHRHRDVEDELALGLEVRAYVRQPLFHVDARVEVQRGVERTDDERETLAEACGADVALVERDALSYLGRLALQELTEVIEHLPGVVDAGDLDARARRRDGHAPVADAVLEHAAALLAEGAVINDVLVTPPVRVRVVDGVFEMSPSACLELEVRRSLLDVERSTRTSQ